MLATGFGADVRQLLKTLKGKEDPASCVLVAATMSKVRRHQRPVTSVSVLCSFPNILAMHKPGWLT